jgi:uncharacterized protein YndB with AHSA1/START domain
MTPLLLQSEELLLSKNNRRSPQLNPDSAISVSVSLNADRRRVFHVLTIAEYMETWLQVPDRHDETPIQVNSDPSGFHVRYLDKTGSPATLVGAYQTYRTAKTSFLWRKTSDPDSVPTIVKIRLDGDFGRTTLNLTHLGITTAQAFEWHGKLWERSLEKLSSLFELQ